MRCNQILLPIITIVTGIISLVLSVILLVASADNKALRMYTTVQLNTTRILQDVIKIEGPSSNRRRHVFQAVPRAFPQTFPTPFPPPPSPPLPNINIPANGIVRIEDPISLASSFFNSIRTSVLPQPTNIVTEGLEFLLNQAFGQLAALFGEAINDALNLLITDVIETLGIKQWYGLYFGKFCSGDYSPNFIDPGASLVNVTCGSTRASSGTPQAPDILTIGPTTIDVSALNIPSKLTELQGQLTNLFRAIFIIALLGTISIGFLILTAPLLFINRFCTPRFYLSIGILATLGSIFSLTTAIIQTAVALIIPGLVNQLAGDLGITAKGGIPLLLLAWFSFIFALIPTSILLTFWFQGTFVRRTKIQDEKRSDQISIKSFI